LGVLNRMDPALRRGAAIVLALIGTVPVDASETDQYYAWSRQPADSTRAINGKVALELELALKKVNGRESWKRRDCHSVIRHIMPQFSEFIYKNIGLWARNAPMVDTVPSSAEEEMSYRNGSIYQDHWFMDISKAIPLSPTITVAGVQIGTDKLAHFFSEGRMYYRTYRSALRSGKSREDAIRHAVDNGMALERTIFGLRSTGVLSVADLEANHRGLQFYTELCNGDDPYFQRTETGWRLRRTFDFLNYVTPEWDESYQPSILTPRRWKRVRPMVLHYCGQLNDPAVREQRGRYASRDRVTLTEERIRVRVDAGKLADPAQFSIETACGDR
jgi:hypothetical protein